MRRVPDTRWAEYFAERAKGRSSEDAARFAHIDPSTAWRFETGDPSSSGLEAAERLGIRYLAGQPIASPVSEAGKKARKDFAYFRRRYMGRTSTPWQERAAYQVQELLATPDREYLVINAPPGTGKSTLFTHDIPAWLIARDRAIRIMEGSRTERQARAYVTRIKKTLERDVPMRADSDSVTAGLAAHADAAMGTDLGPFVPERGDLWRAEALVVRQLNGMSPDDKEATVSAWGQDSGFLGGRYDLVVWDDLVDKRNTRGKEAFDATVEWWKTEAMTRLEPGGLFILQGQRMAPADLYRYCLDMRRYDGSEWYSQIRYPAHDEQRCTGMHDIDSPAWPVGCLLDPVRLPWRDLEAVKTDDPRIYDIQYQQNDGEAGSLLVERAWLDGGLDSRGYEAKGCYDVNRRHAESDIPPGEGWAILTVDPSVEGYWGMESWVMLPEANIFEIVEIQRERLGTQQFLSMDLDTGVFSGLLEDMRERMDRIGHPPTVVVVEAVSAFKHLLNQPYIQRWAAQHHLDVVPHQTGINKNDPKLGVKGLADYVRQGAIRLPWGDVQARIHTKHLTSELLTWPDARTEDMVMSTWFAMKSVQTLYIPARRGGPSFARPGWVSSPRGVPRARGLSYAGR